MMQVPASEQVLTRSGSSFAMAFRLLRRRERLAMTAFYAFCRDVDDAVDLAPDRTSAQEALGRWEREVDLIEVGRSSTTLGRELLSAVTAFHVGTEPLRLVIEGVRRDLERSRTSDFEDLYDYCYHVASAVGMFICAVLTPDDDGVRRYAELTGVAVQLTNVLRDVAEDGRKGRIYLPADDMARFGVTDSEVLEARRTPRLLYLLRFEAARTWSIYDLADGALDPRHRGDLFFARALSRTYRELLALLERSDFGLGGGVIKLCAHRKLAVLARCRIESLLPSRTWLLERRP